MASVQLPPAPDGVTYLPGFLSAPEQSVLVPQIKDLAFTHDWHRGRELKRSNAQFGYAYVATGQQIVPAAPFPAFLTELIAKASSFCPGCGIFDQCMVTHYPAGAGIDWHVDSNGLGDCIVVISLIGDARLQFRPGGAKHPTHELRIAPGSLYLLRGPAREDYQHRVVAVKKDRYSVIFRSVRKPQHALAL
jgi:DNA oxidative demethylase